MELGSLFGLLAVFVLVAANGFFVAGEFALVKVRKTRVDQLVAEGKSAAKLVQRQVEHLDSYIAATQLGITLASLALGWVGEPALAHLIEPLFQGIAGEGAKDVANTVGIAVSFALITTFHIVLGELVPKSIALQRSEGTALFIARPLYLFGRIFQPFIMLMNGIGNLVVRLLGMHSANEHGSIYSVEELEMLVSQSREAGVLNTNEEVMLRRVFDFGDKTANQVMMPRTEIVGVPKGLSLNKLVEIASKERYTRYPVYDGTLDNIIGVIHIKDLFALLHQRQQDAPDMGTTFDQKQILRPVLRVPETVLIDHLLTQMRAKQVHLAVLIDEYGGTAGIVTLEDILEELVGEVQDEFDTRAEGSRPQIEILADGSSSVNGLMTIEEFSDHFGLTLSSTDYETVAGYVFGQLGHTGVVGDEIVLAPYRIWVEEIDDLRIARLRVQPLKAQNKELNSAPSKSVQNPSVKSSTHS